MLRDLPGVCMIHGARAQEGYHGATKRMLRPFPNLPIITSVDESHQRGEPSPQYIMHAYSIKKTQILITMVKLKMQGKTSIQGQTGNLNEDGQTHSSNSICICPDPAC